MDTLPKHWGGAGSAAVSGQLDDKTNEHGALLHALEDGGCLPRLPASVLRFVAEACKAANLRNWVIHHASMTGKRSLHYTIACRQHSFTLQSAEETIRIFNGKHTLPCWVCGSVAASD